MSVQVSLPAKDELLKRFKKVIFMPLEGYCDEVSRTSQGKTYDPEQFASMLLLAQINYCQGKSLNHFTFLKVNMEDIIDGFVDDPDFAAQAKEHYLHKVSSS